MSIYAIGDVQGCYDDLQRLLDLISFDPAADQLWFAGDLVNRGPKSLETLRFVKQLGHAAVTVLGNHDMHLIAIATTQGKLSKKDTLTQILLAADGEELIDWLRQQKLLHANQQFCLLHAGLPPQWDIAFAKQMANEVEATMRSNDYPRFFAEMYGNKPAVWQNDLSKTERMRFTVNCLTRLRYCAADGTLDFAPKGAPGSQAAHLMPWFAVPGRKSANTRIIFGHWSTLGLYQGHNTICIDSGCLWGGKLTALKLLEQPEIFQIAGQDGQNPLDF